MDVASPTTSGVEPVLATPPILLDWSGQRLPYREVANPAERPGTGFGQLKLLVSVLQFLTRYWDARQIPHPTLLYAGAAPGNSLAAIIQLFPEFHYVLYDPQGGNPQGNQFHQRLRLYAEHGTGTTATVQLYNIAFTDQEAVKYSGRSDIFFLSDIRSWSEKQHAELMAQRGLREQAFQENNQHIDQDMQDQQRWVVIIRPAAAWLKFRLPYVASVGPDRAYPYLAGRVYFQPWIGPGSAETRLVVTATEHRVDYSCLAYEQLLFHHNLVTRGLTYPSPLQDWQGAAPQALDNHWDSVATLTIYQDYLHKRGATSSPPRLLQLHALGLVLSGKQQRGLSILAEGRSSTPVTSDQPVPGAVLLTHVTAPVRDLPQLGQSANPAPVVVAADQQARYILVDDGVLLGGTYQRGLVPYLQREYPADHLYAYQSRETWEIYLLVASAALLGKRVTIYGRATTLDPWLKALLAYPAAYYSTTLDRAGVLARLGDATMVRDSFLADSAGDLVPALQQAMAQVTLPRNGRVWLFATSSTLVWALRQALPLAQLSVVTDDRYPVSDQPRSTPQTTWYRLDPRVTTIRPPYSSLSLADGKLWTLVQQQGQEGDIIWQALGERIEQLMY